MVAGFAWGAVWLVQGLNHREEIPVQTSSDGKWQIRVSGQRLWSGSVEVVVSMATPDGSTSRSVQGIEPSFEAFHRKYDKLEFRGDTACALGQPVFIRPVQRSIARVEFFTRDGCVNSPLLLENLKLAIQAFEVHLDYKVVNQGTLAKMDARIGYTTPTILLDARDIFGLPKPMPPFPAPS